ncbi:MAG: hypothetical protein M1832_000249 [Thelocarpon impressellum]|nr:MAG: hypothetical protein M1832_000249 [Thelocarpon impressellum]
MAPDSSSFTALNLPPDSVAPRSMGSFSLHAPPNTDLWRKPPSRDTSTAPILYTALRHPFVAAEVTIAADWELEWDQGGLVIFAGAPPGRVVVPPPPPPAQAPVHVIPEPGSATSAATTAAPPTSTPEAPPAYASAPPASKWVKAGLEFYNGALHASSVCATSEGGDWALAPLSGPGGSAHARADLRVKLERVGYALWIWFEDGGGGWKKLREVTWFFWAVEDKAVRVGVYASRPANFGPSAFATAQATPSARGLRDPVQQNRGLLVEFDGLEIF